MQEETIEQESTKSFLVSDKDDSRDYGTSSLSLDEINELISEMRF